MGISAQSILGSDPEYLSRQLARQEIERYQNFQNPQIGLASTSGALLGRGIANLFGGRGFFEVSDPALRRVSEVNSIISAELSNIDPTDSEAMARAYNNMAKNLAAAGYAQPAILAAQEAAKVGATAKEAVTTFTGMEDGKRIPLYFDKTKGKYVDSRTGKVWAGDVEYKPSSLDPIKEEVAARLRSGGAKTGTGSTTATAKVDKNGKPTGTLNTDKLPPPAEGAPDIRTALAQREALRLKEEAIRQAERQRQLQIITPGPVDEGQMIAP